MSAAEAAGGDNNWMWTADTSTAVGTTSAEAELRQLERRLHQLQGMAQQQGMVSTVTQIFIFIKDFFLI